MPETDADADLTLEVTADDSDADARAESSRALLNHPVVRYEFPSGDLWLVRFDISGKGGGQRFSALVQDTISGRMLAGYGVVGDPSTVTVLPVSHQRGPTDEEFAWAVGALADDELGALLAESGASSYRPVPPLANVANPDGSVDRVIAVGVRAENGEPRHRLVGVRTGDGAVVAEPFGAPAGWRDECGVAAEEGECPAVAGPARARVSLARGDVARWDLVVVRPPSSSGINGSAVELRDVDYKGQRVLARAHVPILNVDGGDGAPAGCAPTCRTWLHDEACFRATGRDPVPGFRVCSEPPSTILDSGDAGGDFRGVALWLDGQDLVIVSQLQAGWYRYVCEWRLQDDGVIKPRFGVGITRNPCACGTQRHHVYWRFDFDVLGAANNLVQEYNDTPVMGTSSWHTTHHEVRRPRAPAANRYWRVRNVRSSQGYSLVPGPDDGEADDYGVGDVWVLRQYEDETDDGHGITTDPALSRAHLDRFVSGESVEREDVVLWYAGHLSQGPNDPPQRIGPDLVPSNWRDLPTSTEKFAPPEPPPRPS